jgi:AraC family L-rhamnose operon transcriptional activator RhaR
MELVFVEGGTGLHLTAQGAYRIEAGDVFAIPPGMAHGYDDCAGLRIANLLFQEKTLIARFPEAPRIDGYRALFHLEPLTRDTNSFAVKMRLERATRDAFRAELDALELEEQGAKRGDPRALLRAWSIVSRLVADAASQFGGNFDGASSAAPVLALARALDAIEHALERGTAGKLRAQDLAATAGMSRAAFFRAFTRALGSAPAAYITAARIERASRCLASGGRVKEAAAAAGYDDVNHFCRVFKARTGTTARKWQPLSASSGILVASFPSGV